VVGSDLTATPVFTGAVTRALDRLIRHGSRETYRKFRSEHP